MDVKTMPKVELHRHLAGCITPRIALEMARRFNSPVPATDLHTLSNTIVCHRPLKSLQDVLGCFDAFSRMFVSPEAVQYAARHAVLDAAADSVRYLELRFSPGFMAFQHSLPLDEVVEAVVSGVADAVAETGAQVPLIAIASREMGPEVCMETFKLASRFAPPIVGVDLAGNEDDFPPEMFTEAFEFARTRGLHATVHAGEQGYPENVEKAVLLLGARRIGHGIRIVDTPEIARLLVRKDVALEISITSNWIINAVPSRETHPVARLRRMGVPICINSDDPALFGITLSGELKLFKRICGLTMGDILQNQVDSLKYAFASQAQIGVVRQELYDWWNRG